MAPFTSASSSGGMFESRGYDVALSRLPAREKNPAPDCAAGFDAHVPESTASDTTNVARPATAGAVAVSMTVGSTIAPRSFRVGGGGLSVIGRLSGGTIACAGCAALVGTPAAFANDELVRITAAM